VGTKTGIVDLMGTQTVTPQSVYTALQFIMDDRIPEAELEIENAVADGADEFLIISLRGGVKLREKKWTEALPLFARAYELKPDDALVPLNLGMCLYESGRFEDAATAYRLSLKRDPKHAKSMLKLAACHMMLQREHDAFACYSMALALTPNDAEVRIGAATIASVTGHDDQAILHYRRAQQLAPDYAEAETGEGFTLLRSGDYQEGWRKFEARWRLKPALAAETYGGKPLWRGEPSDVAGKRLLLRGEQGFGDSIHFARYVPVMQALGADVVMEVAPPLTRLLSGLCPLVAVGEVPEFDLQTSLMTLPKVMGTTLDTVPPPVQCCVDSLDVHKWNERFHQVPGLKVGMVWHGGARPEMPQADAVDKRRSIPYDTFASLFNVPGVMPVSLQLEDMPFTDFADTAALISCLDLVISVDTATAHLAASLGVETWLLNRFDSCWRWGLSGDRTPWYPSMKIYRQKYLGEWDDVILAVRSDLENRVGSKDTGN
jgi:Flp pilus assembly protein TadD